MPTDFLNRRMDLLHNRDNLVDTLTMDTSYPVRLAGKVIKIFTASYDYEARNFNLCNSEKETILIINTSNIYDFAGRVLVNSVGDRKAYPTNVDVFKTGDYVMAVIDFDNNSMYLCSQTNFEKFITGNIDTGEKCKFKLFDITGDTKITFEDGETRSINLDKFQEAIDFEAQEDDEYHSFLRCDNDNIVFETPSITEVTENQNGTDVTVKKYDMKPVSNVSNLNINSINVAIQNFMFPFISTIDAGNPNGYDTISGFRVFQTVNGILNSKFISDYCYTNEQLKALPFFESGNLRAEYNNIPESDKDNYYYTLMVNATDNKYSTDVLNNNLIFRAINKNNMTFATYMDNDGGGVLCSGESIIIPVRIGAQGNTYANVENMVGNWWGNDKNVGYAVWWSDPRAYNTGILVENKNISEYQYNYSQYYKSREFNYDYLISNNCDVEKCYDTTLMKHINRFIDFFIPKDTDESTKYNLAIKCVSLSPVNSTIGSAFGIKNDTTGTITPYCVVATYPELFDDVMFGMSSTSAGNFAHESENIKNFKSFYQYNSRIDGSFDRKKFKTSYRKNAGSHFDNLYLVYSLFELGKTKGYVYTKDKETATVHAIKGLKPEYTDEKIMFKTNQTVLGNSNTNMISNIVNGMDDDKDEQLMLNHISKLTLSKLNEPYLENGESVDYNVSELGHQNFLVVRVIKSADKVISYDETTDTYSITKKNNKSYKLYCITNDGSNNLTMKELKKNIFKNTGSKVSNIMYLYYIEDNKQVYSVKYYYNVTESGSNVSKINKFDYISEVSILTQLSQETKTAFTEFETALLNIYASENDKTKEETIEYYNLNKLTNWKDLVIKCVKTYRMYPYNLGSSEAPNVVVNSPAFGRTYTSSIYVRNNYLGRDHSINNYYHENIYYAAWTNNTELNNGTGFRLRDMIGNDYTIYQNCMVPYVSDTLASNGAKIYNIAAYNKILKNTSVSTLFNTAEFPFLGCKGIRPCYYIGKTLYEFYNYILTRDLSIDINDSSSIIKNKISASNKAFISKSSLSRVKGIKTVYNESTGLNDIYFVNANNDNVQIQAGVTLHANINSNAVLGFNNSKLYSRGDIDVTENYVTDEPIYVNEEKSGNKTVYSLSMNDGNPDVPSVLPINGTSEDISVDKLNWLTLLTALNNNKSVDVLGYVLTKIKKDINQYYIKDGQNVSDVYSVDDNTKTENNANGHDTIYDESSEHYKEHNAEFDNEHNIYNYNYGYGFDNSTDRREIKNRGVIVFVIEDAEVSRITYGQGNPDNFTYHLTEGKIKPKRMYLTKEGILCNKEYYDASVDNVTTDINNMSESALKNIINGLMNNEIEQPTFEKQSDGSLKYKLPNGEYANYSGQVFINGIPYLFNSDGTLKLGWQSTVSTDWQDSKRYYYDTDDGHILLGLQRMGEYKYYITFKDGKLVNRKLETIKTQSNNYSIVNIDDQGAVTDYDFDALISKVNDLETRVKALESKS